MRARLWRRAVLLAAAALIALAAPPAASADDPFFTSTALMITPTDPSTTDAVPIISVGDIVGSFFFEGIPDGIGAMPGAGENVEIFVNHEQSRVPFGTSADLKMASVSHLTLASNGGVVEGSVATPDSVSFQRFCSSTMAGPAEGLEGHLYLTGEEAPEPLPVPEGAPYGSDPAYAPADTRQSGLVAVLDPVSGEFTAVPGMGHNHENIMALPGGWDQIALFSGDDTFTPPAPASQMYLYLANDEREIWDDEGTLWAFRVTHKNGVKVAAADTFNDANDYSDIGLNDHVAGRFIRVPEMIAKGLTQQQPQDALETWSNSHNVFQFIRIEDTAYDPRVGPGENPVMFFTDTGNGNVIEDPTTGQLMAGAGPFNRGRVLRMEFAPDNPKKVVDLSILLDGNFSPNPFPSPAPALRSPDNLGTSEHSLMVQEDTSSQVSRVLRYDLDAPAGANPWSIVASVNDQDWESSGIVDASAFFGDGTWLLDVQAHDVRVGTSETVGGITFKREGGQLILLTVDGS